MPPHSRISSHFYSIMDLHSFVAAAVVVVTVIVHGGGGGGGTQMDLWNDSPSFPNLYVTLY